MNSGYIVNEIKLRVKMPELLRRYGFDIRRNRIPCHIHGGKNDNLGIKEEYCHCFKCGYNADIIKFVKDYYSLSFSDTLSKINDDFSLGLPIGEKIGRRKQIDIARESFQRKKEQKNKQSEYETLLNEWENAHDEFIKLERKRIEYKPKSRLDELLPEYIEILKEIEYAKYRLGCAEEELMEYEKRNN